MDLGRYVEEINRQLQSAAEAGGEEARVIAERLVAPLDAAVRLSFLEALSAAAQEITCELVPGSVEVRLRGRDPEFVVTSPVDPVASDQGTRTVQTSIDLSGGVGAVGAVTGASAGDENGTARVNVRMPEHIKARVDQAAAREGLSINTWLVRAAASALERADPSRTSDGRGPQSSQRFTGWAR
jgi:hypothetical protein